MRADLAVPIPPEKRKLYPPRAEWLAIRGRILERAQNRCEFCGVADREAGSRDPSGKFWTLDELDRKERDEDRVPTGGWDEKIIFIVLTVAHLDHDPRNNDPANLRALCQRCHLRHDAGLHAANARATRERKSGQIRMEW